jgi:hypothetical protein
MERNRPRFGSICLPTGHEKLRLVLVPLALIAGVVAGVEFYSAFEETAEAIAVGVLTADIALHVVDLLVHALAFSRWAWVFAFELVLGTVVGVPFFLAFADTGEAIAVGLMAANITLHLAELATGRGGKRRPGSAGRSNRLTGFGGTAASAGASA